MGAMMRKMISLLAAAVLLIGSASCAAAEARKCDLNQYANCTFSEIFDVYSGPGIHYYRGSGKYGWTHSVYTSTRVWGRDGDWLMIGYRETTDYYRIGYMSADALKYLQSSDGNADKKLEFTNYIGLIREGGAPLTDDPLINCERIVYLPAGTEVTVLGEFKPGDYEWYYVEAPYNDKMKCRGFVRRASLTMTDRTAVPTLPPDSPATPQPTAAPVTAAPITAAPVTAAPITAAPITAAPITAAPVTAVPYTQVPTIPPTPVPTSTPRSDGYESLLGSLTHNCPNTGIMVPSSFSPFQTSYILTVASWVSRVRFTPTAYDYAAVITVNGEKVVSGGTSSYIQMTDKPQQVDIVVTAANGVRTTYTVFLQRRPSEARTRVSAGYIKEIYQSKQTYYIAADLVELQYYSSDYSQGSRSTFTNNSSYLYRYEVDPNCDFYYGSTTGAIHAKDIYEFMANYRSYYSSGMYTIVYINDKIVAVMPYQSGY